GGRDAGRNRMGGKGSRSARGNRLRNTHNCKPSNPRGRASRRSIPAASTPACSYHRRDAQRRWVGPRGHQTPSISGDAMNRYSLSDFVQQTAQRDQNQGLFELERERTLEVNLNGMVWTKTGSMVAYLGNIKFTREGILEHGIGTFLKKAFTGEGARLT